MGPIAIFARFLRFGVLAFGGPVAQIAMIRRELIDQERWIEPDRFNRLLAIYQALPGPEAHELCVHLGLLKGGRLGGLLAGLGFMLPGFLIVLGLAMAYRRLDLANPQVAAAMLGAQVAVVAMIVVAVPRIGRHILTDRWRWTIAGIALAATIAGVPFWIVLGAAAIAYPLLASRRWLAAAAIAAVALAAGWLFAGADLPSSAASGSPSPSIAALFVAGLKGGLLTFGGAYTAIPFVRADTVGRGWIGDGQFLDGLALSGLAPAPLVIFVTFIGYVVGGVPGALAMTAGMFLPAFSFGLLFHHRLEALIDDPRLHGLLDGIAAGVVGIIAATAIDLAWRLAVRIPSVPVGLVLFAACLAALLLIRKRWIALVLVPTAAAAGLVLMGAAPYRLH